MPLLVPEDLPVPVPPYLADTEVTRRDIRRLYSNIRMMDEQVGSLPRGKRLLYDSGIRVPMIVAWPDGRRAGQIDSSLFSFVDLAPTTFRLAGVDLPAYCEGQAILGEAAAPPRDYVFAHTDWEDEEYDRIRAARDRRYKYLRNAFPERPYYLPVDYREQMGAMQELLRLRDAGQLDDVQADPYELHNLAG